MFRTKSRNPLFRNMKEETYFVGDAATYNGITIKSAYLLTIVFISAYFAWTNLVENPEILFPIVLAGGFLGFIFVMVAMFSARLAPIFGTLYAVVEGAWLGAISRLFEEAYPGIAFSAINITFAIFIFLLVVYSTGLFKVGFAFRKFVYTATFGLLIFYLFTWIIGLFSPGFAANVFGYGENVNLAIGIALIVTLLATFNLLIDFDNAKMMVQSGAPKKYEWTISLGLLVTIIWLYTDILRLLAILRRD